jgi:hypothetical protein
LEREIRDLVEKSREVREGEELLGVVGLKVGREEVRFKRVKGGSETEAVGGE